MKSGDQSLLDSTRVRCERLHSGAEFCTRIAEFAHRVASILPSDGAGHAVAGSVPLPSVGRRAMFVVFPVVVNPRHVSSPGSGMSTNSGYASIPSSATSWPSRSTWCDTRTPIDFSSPSCPKTRTNSRPASAGAFRIDASRFCSPSASHQPGARRKFSRTSRTPLGSSFSAPFKFLDTTGLFYRRPHSPVSSPPLFGANLSLGNRD